MYFTLQRRRGQDEEKSGLASLLVATWDSVTESKPHKYRIIHHRENSEIYYSKKKNNQKFYSKSFLNFSLNYFLQILFYKFTFVGNKMRVNINICYILILVIYLFHNYRIAY